MSIPDNLMGDYFELLTDIPDGELTQVREQIARQKLNPMVAKKRLAGEIVAQFHGKPAAGGAEAHFTRVFQRREVPEEAPEFAVSPGKVDVVSLLVDSGLAKSRSEAKRLIIQRAVEIDGTLVTEETASASVGNLLRCGKRRFLRLVEKKN